VDGFIVLRSLSDRIGGSEQLVGGSHANIIDANSAVTVVHLVPPKRDPK
jgi:hypothetical protein